MGNDYDLPRTMTKIKTPMEMEEYPEIRYVLRAFSVGVGLSDNAERDLLRRMLANDSWRPKFETELARAFASASTSWRELLFNEAYEVVETDSEGEARQIASELLWNETFPTRQLPVQG